MVKLKQAEKYQDDSANAGCAITKHDLNHAAPKTKRNFLQALKFLHAQITQSRYFLLEYRYTWPSVA